MKELVDEEFPFDSELFNSHSKGGGRGLISQVFGVLEHGAIGLMFN